MPASSAQPLYDHARPRRRPAPDWGGDELFDAVPRRRFARGDEASAPEAPAPEAPERHLRVAEEPEPPAPAPAPAPLRPAVVQRPRPRTLEQRIYARPAGLAAWAFALSLLLIVIAVATSG